MNRAAAALLCALALDAGGVRLDDSASPKRRLDVEPRWLHEQGPLDTPERLNTLVATMRDVEVRLNTAAYVGRRGRIYLEMPQFVPGLGSPGAMRLEWRARGLFQSGSAIPGERKLLYDGPITQPQLTETFDFNVYIDARHQQAPLRFDPVFDLELLP